MIACVCVCVMLVISVCCSWHGVDSPACDPNRGKVRQGRGSFLRTIVFEAWIIISESFLRFGFRDQPRATFATFEHSCLVSPRILWMCACARTASPKHIQTLQVEISADLDLDLVEAGPKYPNMSKRGRTWRAVEGSPDSQGCNMPQQRSFDA